MRPRNEFNITIPASDKLDYFSNKTIASESNRTESNGTAQEMSRSVPFMYETVITVYVNEKRFVL